MLRGTGFRIQTGTDTQTQRSREALQSLQFATLPSATTADNLIITQIRPGDFLVNMLVVRKYNSRHIPRIHPRKGNFTELICRSLFSYRRTEVEARNIQVDFTGQYRSINLSWCCDSHQHNGNLNQLSWSKNRCIRRNKKKYFPSILPD
ncbi:unnamed protein product, partial [Nesidiocoris tenuis]